MESTVEQTVVKLKTEEFILTLDTWCVGNNFDKIHLSMLPTDVYVNVEEDVYTHCIFAIETNTQICWLAFPVANPFIDKSKGRLTNLVNKVENIIKEKGYHIMFTTSNTPKIKGLLGNLNYMVGDKNVNHYFKGLN